MYIYKVYKVQCVFIVHGCSVTLWENKLNNLPQQKVIVHKNPVPEEQEHKNDKIHS